jgi:flagella basal body P-ring formation protein FlgA
MKPMLPKKSDFLKIVCFFFISLFSGVTLADSYESFENLKKTAENFLSQTVSAAADESVSIQVNRLYPPLKVAVCSQAIEAALPKEANKDQITAVDLTCNGLKPWHILIPVDVAINTKVLVAKHTIPGNQIISADDLDYAFYNRNRLYSGYFKHKADIVGQVAVQAIPVGSVLTKKNIQLPILVHRNQVIEIVARSSSIEISMKGVAISDGSLNQMIKVYNPSSKRTLDALVISSNKAEAVS